jgi:hypothetical protein
MEGEPSASRKFQEMSRIKNSSRIKGENFCKDFYLYFFQISRIFQKKILFSAHAANEKLGLGSSGELPSVMDSRVGLYMVSEKHVSNNFRTSIRA